MARGAFDHTAYIAYCNAVCMGDKKSTRHLRFDHFHPYRGRENRTQTAMPITGNEYKKMWCKTTKAPAKTPVQPTGNEWLDKGNNGESDKQH